MHLTFDNGLEGDVDLAPEPLYDEVLAATGGPSGARAAEEGVG